MKSELEQKVTEEKTRYAMLEGQLMVRWLQALQAYADMHVRLANPHLHVRGCMF
jgi:hypothetical protein